MNKVFLANNTFIRIFSFMNRSHMVFQVKFWGKAPITHRTFKWLVVICCSHMLIQVGYVSKSFITKNTFIGLFHIMKSTNMSFESTFSCKCFIAILTFVWFFFFMNCPCVSIQFTLSRKSTVTFWAFKRPISFMNFLNMGLFTKYVYRLAFFDPPPPLVDSFT